MIPAPAFLSLERSGTVLLQLWVQPGAKRSAPSGLHGARLKVRLAAPPVDGKANLELLRCLADWLGLPVRDLELVAGRSGRAKTVRIHHLALEGIAEQLAGRMGDAIRPGPR